MEEAVVFTVEELWYLHSVVRHGAEPEWKKFPPYSLDLNDQIIAAIVWCEVNGQESAALSLSRGDCLVIDYCAKPGDKAPTGKPIGKDVLRKSMFARAALAGLPTTIEDELPIEEEKVIRLAQWRASVATGDTEIKED